VKVQDHGNNLIQLTYYGFVNVYLLREDDGFTLIDTALEGCARSIVQVARQFGQPIVRILLTHAHADHSGGLDAVHALVPDAQFVMPARDARFLSGDMSLRRLGNPQDRSRSPGAGRRACRFARSHRHARTLARALLIPRSARPHDHRGRCLSDDGGSCGLRHLQATVPAGLLRHLAQRAGPGERPQAARP